MDNLEINIGLKEYGEDKNICFGLTFNPKGVFLPENLVSNVIKFGSDLGDVLNENLIKSKSFKINFDKSFLDIYVLQMVNDLYLTLSRSSNNSIYNLRANMTDNSYMITLI